LFFLCRAPVAEATAEALYATGGVYNFLLTCVKGMAAGAHFYVLVFHQGGASFHHVSAAAGDLDWPIFRVDVGFHACFRLAVVLFLRLMSLPGARILAENSRGAARACQLLP